jgi:hypothetical protein
MLSEANTGTLPSGFVQSRKQRIQPWNEVTDEVNGGDFAFKNNRIFSSFDYFSRNTAGILIAPPVASAFRRKGQSKEAVNGAKIK